MPTAEYPLVQLVDAPNSSAVVRFDFNEGMTWAAHDGFSLGAPPLLGDPGGVNPEYGYRSPSFNVVVEGGEPQAMAVQSRLARELMRNENWLHFKLTPQSEPMWLRCVRSTPGELSLANVYLERETSQYGISVSLVADPFAVGREVTHRVGVTNDPTDPQGLSVNLPLIHGDAPAPATVEMDPHEGESVYIQPLLSVIALDAPFPGVVHRDASAPGNVMGLRSVAVTDATASAQTAVEVSAVGDTIIRRRITADVVVPFAGRWRAFVRARRKIGLPSNQRITVVGAGGAALKTVSTDLSTDQYGRWDLIELGTYAFPRGNPPTARPYTIGPGSFGVDVGFGGASSVFFDYFVFIPVDLPLDQVGTGSICEFRAGERTRSDLRLRLDGEAQRISMLSGDTEPPLYEATYPETPVGGFPYLTPGATNMLTLLTRRRLSQAVPFDLLAPGTTLTLKYRPRYVYLASP